jgi:hypothetical protein
MGGGHPLSIDTIVWRNTRFDAQGEIWRYDWLEKPHNLNTQTEPCQIASFLANHSAALHPTHQITEVRQKAV